MVNTDSLARAVGELLQERHLTLAVAESCTGGLLATHITNIPGSSAYFEGGVVAYSNDV
jgi:nicotinamide-nucleotide amidase